MVHNVVWVVKASCAVTHRGHVTLSQRGRACGFSSEGSAVTGLNKCCCLRAGF